jgi:hypothetical protein
MLTEENYISLRLALANTLSEYYMNELGVSIPLGLYHSLGVSWIGLGTSPFTPTDFNQSSGQIEAISGQSEVADRHDAVIVSYALNPWKQLSVGINAALLHQNLFDRRSATGGGVDIGLSYRFLNHPVLGDHVAGVSTQNLVSVLNSGERFARNVKLAWHGHYLESRVETSIDFNLRDLLADPSDFSGDPTLEWGLNGQCGFWIFRIIKLYALSGFSDNGFDFWGLAAGVNVPSVNAGRDLFFAYQYLSVRDGAPGSHTLYAKTDVGKHREEVYARKMARMINIEPNNLYRQAMQLYTEKKYWDAFYIFSRIVVEYPDFFKNDWVEYYMGSCQENLDMRKSSLERYRSVEHTYPRSTVRHHATLGIMRIEYRNEDFPALSRIYHAFKAETAPDSLEYHADYLFAEAMMKEGEYLKAALLFQQIPYDHPDYIFAQHSAAIAYLIEDNVTDGYIALNNCLSVDVKTEAKREIQNRSRVMLGYMFYEGVTGEEYPFAKAVTILRKVPESSFYYEDALLGLGWTALKLRQWVDCETAGKELYSVASTPVVQAEGALLWAYSLTALNNYNAAQRILEGAVKKILLYSPPSEFDKTERTSTYRNVRNEYDGIAETMNNLSRTRQSSEILTKIDSLHPLQKDAHARIIDYFTYLDNFNREFFFSRNLETVKNELEYLLATTMKRAGAEKEIKAKEKLKKEEEKIDKEIERLEEEMEKLEEENTGE